jgi:peptide/nickel transport system substrate-binding protein
VAAVVANPKLRLISTPGLGFQIISFNLNKPPGSASSIGQSALVRQALDKAIDRRALNEVVFEGKFVPSNQTEPPGGRYWNPALPVAERDVEGAKALLRQAGIPHPSFTLFIGTDAVNAQIGQVLQSMAGEAGFEIKLQAMDGLSALEAERRGAFEAAMGIWSGRPDPDGNASIWFSCAGFLNWGQYCNKDLDAALEAGSALTDPAARVPFYRKAAELQARDRSHMVLFHFTWLWGLNERVEGAKPMPDGILRPAGVRLKN